MTAIVITRAEPGASETAATLTGWGLEVIKTPALRIESHPLEADWSPQPGEFVIFTSANGVHAYLEAEWSLDQFAICVGPATTAAAADAGFENLMNTDGDADALVKGILDSFDPAETPLVHYANDAAAGAVCQRLRDAGYKARFVPLYGALPVSWHQVGALWQVGLGEQSAILIHSAKAAIVVDDWIEKGGIATENLLLVAISERAAAPLIHRKWHCVQLAEHPNEMKLIEALQIAIEAGVSLKGS